MHVVIKRSSFEKPLEIQQRDLYQYTLENFRFWQLRYSKIKAILHHPFLMNCSKSECFNHVFQLFVPNVRSTFHRTKSLSHLGPKIWDIVSEELKKLSNIWAFKNAIKKWKPQSCHCQLSTEFKTNLGFIWYFLTSRFLVLHLVSIKKLIFNFGMGKF